MKDVNVTASDFRLWCTTKWYEHKSEVLEWTGKPVEYTAEQYFRKYRWWLWREFKAATFKDKKQKFGSYPF